jgi:hypothetical protein
MHRSDGHDVFNGDGFDFQLRPEHQEVIDQMLAYLKDEDPKSDYDRMLDEIAEQGKYRSIDKDHGGLER